MDHSMHEAPIVERGMRAAYRAGTAVVLGHSIDDLAAIARPDVQLAVWRRKLAPSLAAWLDTLSPDVLPELHTVGRPGALGHSLVRALDACAMPADDMRAYLVEDVTRLAAVFARIVGTAEIDLRLERIADDACWRFHRDCVDARLITTYRGPATEWVAPENADDAIAAQTGYSGPIECLEPHDVALFKGSCAGQGQGIVHRSPPVAGTRLVRLLLVLNDPRAFGHGY